MITPLQTRYCIWTDQVLTNIPLSRSTTIGPDSYHGNGEGRGAWYDERQTVKKRREELDQGSSG